MTKTPRGPYVDAATRQTARFLSRPNRFVVRCSIDGVEHTTYLPNPDRLTELLLSNTRIWLTRSTNTSKKLPLTVVGAERLGKLVLLDTHATNRISVDLIDTDQVEALEGYRSSTAKSSAATADSTWSSRKARPRGGSR